MTHIGDIELEAIQGLHLLSEFFCRGFDSKNQNLKKRGYKSQNFSVNGIINDDKEPPRKKKKPIRDIVDDIDDDYDDDDDDVDEDFDDESCFNYGSSRKSKKSTSQSSNRRSNKPSVLNEPTTDEWFDMIQRALKDHAGNEATITELVIWLAKNIDFCKYTPVEVWKRKLTNLLGHHPRRFVRRDRDKNNPKESARPGTGGFWGLCKDYMNKTNSKSNNTNSSQSSDSQSSNDSETSESDDKNNSNKEHALRPTLATADIIQQVLMSQSDKKGSCNEIFQWIAEKFPWFKTQPTKRWHHTVRHALSSYKDLFIHFSPKDSSYKPPRGGFYGLKQYYDKDGRYVGKTE